MTTPTILELPRSAPPRGLGPASSRAVRSPVSGSPGEAAGDGFAGLLREMSQAAPRSRTPTSAQAESAGTPKPEGPEPGPARARGEAADADDAQDDPATPETEAEQTPAGSAAGPLLVPLAQAPVEVETESVEITSSGSEPAPRTAAGETGTDRGHRLAGGQSGAEPAPLGSPAGSAPSGAGPAVRETAFDLLAPREMTNAEVRVDADGGQMLERLQRALARGDGPSLDEAGRPLVPQVVRSIATLSRNGMSEMRVHLQPADLGQIEVRVRATDGVIRGEVMVQNPVVKNLLDSQVERLREALAGQGMQLGGLDVGVSPDGAFTGEREGDGWQPFGGGAEGLGPRRPPAENPRVNAVPRRPQQLGGDGQVHWLV